MNLPISTLTSHFWQNLDGSIVKQIYEIEQDSWAREKWLGEYIICGDCGGVSSKEMIYKDLPRSITKLTVAKIEKLLELKRVKCSHCNSDNTSPIYWWEHFEKMMHKFWLPESFCTLMWNTSQKVSWFVFWYVKSLDYIYENELKVHFNKWVISYLQHEFEFGPDEKFITFSSLGTDEENMSMSKIYSMIKEFFRSLPNSSSNYYGIIEAIRWSHMEWIYKEMWAKESGIERRHPEFVLNTTGAKTDILLQPAVVSAYKKSFPWSIKELLRAK